MNVCWSVLWTAFTIPAQPIKLPVVLIATIRSQPNSVDCTTGNVSGVKISFSAATTRPLGDREGTRR